MESRIIPVSRVPGIRSFLAAMPDGRLERILRDLPYRRLYTVFYELRRDDREEDA